MAKWSFIAAKAIRQNEEGIMGKEKVLGEKKCGSAGKKWRRLCDILLSFRGAWVFTFLCWIPAFLADWPGVFVIDNVFQMRWYLEGTISAHHPIIHTYLLGGILNFGKAVFDSWEAGMCIFSLLQMLFLSAVFAWTLKVLSEHTGKRFRMIVLLCYALIPYNPVSAFTATKDTIFAGLFLLTVVSTWRIVCDREAFFSSWKRIVLYIVLIFFMCAFRNTGIYIFIFSLPVFFIICKKYWKKLLLIALSCIVLWGVYTGPVYRLLNIAEGSSAEMLSVPIQQLARVMVNAPEDMTDDQWELAVQYMPDYSRYASRVSDPVKDSFNAELFEEDPVRFIKLWVEVGLRAPVVYAEAFLSTNIGFWNPFMQYPDPGTYLAYIPYNSADLEQVGVSWEGQVLIENKSMIPVLDTFYEKMTETGGYNRIPGMSFVYNIAVAFLLTAAGGVYCMVKKRYETLVPYFLLLGLWGTLMLSPVVAFRYGYPLIISLPVVFAMCRSRKAE